MTRLSLLPLTMALAIASGSVGAQAPSAAALLAEASEKATVEGNLPDAIRLYQRVVDQYKRSDRSSAAAALLRIADCYSKIGDSRAVETYQRVLAEFSDVSAAVSVARSRLLSSSTSIEPHLLCDTCGDPGGAISPDGKSLIFVDGSGNVVALNLANGSIKTLVAASPGQGSGDSVVLSRDARQIAVTWETGSAGSRELRLVPNGAAGTSRAFRASADVQDLVPSGVAPDGRVLVQEETRDGKWQLAWVSADFKTTAPLAPLSWRSDADVVDSVHEASVSPSGRYVAFSMSVSDQPRKPLGVPFPGPGPDRHVYLVPATGGTPVDLTAAGQHSRSPIWLDDTRLIYTGDASGTWDLWMQAIRDGHASGAPVRLKSNVGRSSAIGMTRTGTYVFYREIPGASETSITPVAGTVPSEGEEHLVGGRATWSPDGRSIALVRRHPPDGDGFDLIVHDLAAHAERVFTRPGLRGNTPFWFHDGKALLVIVSPSPTEANWFRLDLESGQFQRVADLLDDPAVRPDWFSATLSPDDRFVYSGAWANGSARLDRIVAFDLATGRYHVVAQLGDDMLPNTDPLGLAVSPDGTRLSAMATDASHVAHLMVMDINGVHSRELATARNDYPDQQLTWSADGRTIWFMRSNDGGSAGRLMRIAADGGAPAETGLALARGFTVQVSPDGTRALSSTGGLGARYELWSLDVAGILKAAHSGGTR